MAANHVVIIGGSIAGVSAAMAMRDHGHAGRITIVEAGSIHPYERPPLSKALLTMVEPKFIHPAETYRERDIELVLGRRAVAIDPDAQTVTLDDGSVLSADSLLLATGVSARRLHVPGVGLANVLTLRDVDDARAVAKRMRGTGPIVIVGGGFIGLEAAAVARELDRDVTVIEALPVPLLPALGGALALLLKALHDDRGVHMVTGQSITAFRGTGAVDAVELADGTVLPASTVLVGIGVVPNDLIAASAGIECAGGIVVDEHGRTNHPWVWAAGDVTSQETTFTDGRERIEHWDVAMRHGVAVGASMAGVLTSNDEVPYFWSDHYGLTLQVYGRPTAAYDTFVLRRGARPERFLAFWLRDGCLIAAAGMDQARELRSAKALIEAKTSVNEAALEDPDVSLRALLRAARPATANEA